MPEDLETINKSELPFADLLPQVAEEIPHIVEVLQRAQNNRTKVLNAKARGVRLAGLNQWLGYLKELEAAFLDPRLEPLRFLLVRIRMNYDAAIEATLTGMPSVVNDLMRDVMEIELLLQDFAATPANWRFRRRRTSIPEGTRTAFRAEGERFRSVATLAV